MKYKILIAEDDADIKRSLSIRLEAMDYDVVLASDGLQGICTAVKERPDLLILDINMPAGDGFSILERIRTHTDLPEIPAIFITASTLPDLRKFAMDLGAVAFFEKPYDSAELMATVKRTLEDPASSIAALDRAESWNDHSADDAGQESA